MANDSPPPQADPMVLRDIKSTSDYGYDERTERGDHDGPASVLVDAGDILSLTRATTTEVANDRPSSGTDRNGGKCVQHTKKNVSCREDVGKDEGKSETKKNFHNHHSSGTLKAPRAMEPSDVESTSETTKATTSTADDAAVVNGSSRLGGQVLPTRPGALSVRSSLYSDESEEYDNLASSSNIADDIENRRNNNNSGDSGGTLVSMGSTRNKESDNAEEAAYIVEAQAVDDEENKRLTKKVTQMEEELMEQRLELEQHRSIGTAVTVETTVIPEGDKALRLSQRRSFQSGLVFLCLALVAVIAVIVALRATATERPSSSSSSTTTLNDTIGSGTDENTGMSTNVESVRHAVVKPGSKLHKIKERGYLRCGVGPFSISKDLVSSFSLFLSSDSVTGEVKSHIYVDAFHSLSLSLISQKQCLAVAAAIFGPPKTANETEAIVEMNQMFLSELWTSLASKDATIDLSTHFVTETMLADVFGVRVSDPVLMCATHDAGRC